MFKKIVLLLMIGVMVLVLTGCPSQAPDALYISRTDGHLKIAFDEFTRIITHTASLAAGTVVNFDIMVADGLVIITMTDGTGEAVSRLPISLGHTFGSVTVEIASDFVFTIEGQDFTGLVEILW